MRQSKSRQELSPSFMKTEIAKSLLELVKPSDTFSKDRVTVMRGPMEEHGLEANSFIIQKLVPRFDGKVLFRWQVSVQAASHEPSQVTVPAVQQVDFVSIDPNGFGSLTGPRDPIRVLFDTLKDRNLRNRLESDDGIPWSAGRLPRL